MKIEDTTRIIDTTGNIITNILILVAMGIIIYLIIKP